MLKAATVVLSILVLCSFSFAAQNTCDNIAIRAGKEEAALFPVAGYKVIGEGRLYFHTAPGEGCRDKAVFVVPGDELVAYSEYKGWFSVMYMNPKTGKDYQGWVQSKRLKFTGTMAPGN